MSNGPSGSGAAAVGQRNMQQDGQQLDTVLVFVNDYHPGVGIEVVSRLQQPIVNSILGSDEQGEPVVDPTDYNGYIYNYTGCGPGEYNLVFLREGTLQQGQTYSFTTSATFWSNRLQLLETGIQTGGGGAGADGNQTDGAAADQADNETAGVDNATDDDATAVDNATEAGNDTVEVTNVTVGNETAGNETG